ncbi:MAG: nicotinate phosphoribosyltransferase, partial [Promethearchaeota archaeon]
NEYKIKEITDKNAPIDAFGVGTELATSRDDPSISGVYKLIEYNTAPKIKISEEKITYPGIKQVFRLFDENGMFKNDILGLDTEVTPDRAELVLKPIMKKAKIIIEMPELSEIQAFYNENIKKLPDIYKSLDPTQVLDLEISPKLEELTDLLMKKHT